MSSALCNELAMSLDRAELYMQHQHAQDLLKRASLSSFMREDGLSEADTKKMLQKSQVDETSHRKVLMSQDSVNKKAKVKEEYEMETEGAESQVHEC